MMRMKMQEMRKLPKEILDAIFWLVALLYLDQHLGVSATHHSGDATSM